MITFRYLGPRTAVFSATTDREQMPMQRMTSCSSLTRISHQSVDRCLVAEQAACVGPVSIVYKLIRVVLVSWYRPVLVMNGWLDKEIVGHQVPVWRRHCATGMSGLKFTLALTTTLLIHRQLTRSAELLPLR